MEIGGYTHDVPFPPTKKITDFPPLGSKEEKTGDDNSFKEGGAVRSEKNFQFQTE